MTEKGFIFDYSKCVACHACIVACHNHNQTQLPLVWRQVFKGNPTKIPLKGFINLSLACNHCIEAPCLSNCPAMAYCKDSFTGAILHNAASCIGCKYCTWACPFDAPKFNPNRGVVEKCNLCNDIVAKGGIPTCANACPTGALSFGTIEVEPSLVSPGFPPVQTYPRIETKGLEAVEENTVMDVDATGFNPLSSEPETHQPKINVLAELPLVLFTLMAALLAGWFVKFYGIGDGLPRTTKVAFTVTLSLAGIISTLHLGKPLRAYRSMLHVKSSWLSREIIFFSIFSIVGITYLFTENIAFFWLTVPFAIAMLVSIEMVYHVVQKNFNLNIHSSNTLLTAAAFAALLVNPKVFIALVVVKALLYMVRLAYSSSYSGKMFLLALVRVMLGLLFPLSFLLLHQHQELPLYVIAAFIVGEIIDRVKFYGDIDTFNPKKYL